MDRTDARTAFEARNDVLYNVFLWQLHRRLYDRAAKVIGFAELSLGSGAFVAAFASSPKIIAVCGIVLGLLTIVNHVVGPTRRMMLADEAHRRYTALRAESVELELAVIDRRLAAMDAEDPETIEALRPVAFNCLIESMSQFTQRRDLTRFERFVKFLA